MQRLPQITRFWLCLLCVLLVATRISGMHLHLCFDGAEPPISVHLNDFGADIGHQQSSHGHSDVELTLSGDWLVKKSAAALDLLVAVILATVLVLVTNVAAPAFIRHRTSPVPLSAAFRLQPPLRGPPL